MSVSKASKEILKEAGKPLHAHEITEQIIAKGLWSPKGKTPVATVSAQLYRDIKKKGDPSDFELVAPQTFALKKLGLALDNDVAIIEEIKPHQKHEMKIFSFSDCAVKVLEEFGSKNPMHYRVITNVPRQN